MASWSTFVYNENAVVVAIIKGGIVMKVSSLVCCAEIINDPQGQAILNTPLQIFNLVNIPSAFSFALSVGLIDVLENDIVKISIKNPDNEEINVIGPISIPPFPKNIDKNKTVGMQLNFNVQNMVFNSMGMHSIEVLHDGKSLLKTYFSVAKVEEK